MIEANGKKEKKEKKEYSGSRWAGIILLVATLLISLIFYLKGQIKESGGIKKVSWPKMGEFKLFGSARYEIKK